jgi:uncharacterized protein YfbU (UPF0304 family)
VPRGTRHPLHLLKQPYDRTADKKDIQKYMIKIAGFDGSNEGAYLTYCRCICEGEGRLQTLNRGDNYIIHRSFLALYQRMLAEWRRWANKCKLIRDDFVRITSGKM